MRVAVEEDGSGAGEALRAELPQLQRFEGCTDFGLQWRFFRWWISRFDAAQGLGLVVARAWSCQRRKGKGEDEGEGGRRESGGSMKQDDWRARVVEEGYVHRMWRHAGLHAEKV